MADRPESTIEHLYRPGLSRVQESVISEHFMHRLNQAERLDRLDDPSYCDRALQISSSTVSDVLIPILCDAAERFAQQRADVAAARARRNYREYGAVTDRHLTPADVIAEAMFDRQFSRSASANLSRSVVARRIADVIERGEPIRLVVPALPYKCATPLKSRGHDPDLAEVGFLLSLFEIARTIDLIHGELVGGSDHSAASFTVVSDGRRFNESLLEPADNILRYQEGLRRWISHLSISAFVRVSDYDEVLRAALPPEPRARKALIRSDVYERYQDRMGHLLDTEDMSASMSTAIADEPDPETSNAEGRFIPLFKSLIYTTNYRILTRCGRRYGESFEELYATLTKHIFAPFDRLDADEISLVEASIAQPVATASVPKSKFYEYLRRAMIQEAWDATMQYLSEIRSDRDLEMDPITLCFPGAIRWTIHAKPGQFALQTNPAAGIPVQPWHGAGIFKRTRTTGIKLCALPSAGAESIGALPVVVANAGRQAPAHSQPLFYLHPDLEPTTVEDFLAILPARFTRRRI